MALVGIFYSLRSFRRGLPWVAIVSQAVFKRNYGPVKISFVAETLAPVAGDKDALWEAAEKMDIATQKYWFEMRPHIDTFQSTRQRFSTELPKFYPSQNTWMQHNRPFDTSM